MKRELRSPCSACGGPVRVRTIKQEFEREGVRVPTRNRQAWSASISGATRNPVVEQKDGVRVFYP